MAGATNTGVVGYISNPIATFPENSITIDILGNTFYRDYVFGAGDDTGVYWNESNPYSESVMLYMAAAIKKAVEGKYNYGFKLRSSKSYDIKIQLPAKNGKIDFNFMESFISKLEEERISELDAYLKASGLNDYKLSSEEEKALQNYSQLKWDTYNLKTLFGKSTRGKRLKGDDRIAGVLPFVTAGEANEGISAYISNEVEVFEKNTTTIDMFGSAKYRNYQYGADDHIAVVHTEAIPMKAAIFLTAAIHKAAHTGKFDYGHNFYAKDADALDIVLPTKDKKPDYGSMSLLISAVQKLVIKDVVKYSKKKLETTKKVVGGYI